MQTTPVVKALAAWLLGLMLVGAAFILTVAVLNGRVYTPESQVERYLQALREGDGGTALGLLDAMVPQGTDGTLLDGDALARSTAALQDVEIGDARDVGADRVEVPVTYSVDGNPTTTVLPLQRTGKEWGFFDVWRFEETVLPAVEVSAVNSVEAEVNGSAVGLPDGRALLASFFPAHITAEYEAQYFAAPEQRATVTGEQAPPKLALGIEATPELIDVVDQQVRAFLDDCAEQTVFQPANCPFAYPTNERLAGRIAWSIEDYPTPAVTAEDGAWQLAPLRGTARIDTRLLDFFSGAERDVSEPIPFEFDAALTIVGDDVAVTPDVRY